MAAKLKPRMPAVVGPFPWDQRLREKGFRLLSRPNKGPTLWTRDGKTYTEAEAMRLYLAHYGEA